MVSVSGKPIDSSRTQKVLKHWISGPDAMTDQEARARLSDMGMDGNEGLQLLASYKSEKKYGYPLNPAHVRHILDLAERNCSRNPLHQMIQNPFLLAKVTWIDDHAPAFLFYNQPCRRDQLDETLLNYADDYYHRFLESNPDQPPADTYDSRTASDVLTTSFWERNTWDPAEIVLNIIRKNLRGIELAFDFHPFNLTKILPEELDPNKRLAIKKLTRDYGVALSIHSPIVGPYRPRPDPAGGKQLFINPTKCMMLMKDTIRLASDIGARCVVIHLIDPGSIPEWLELIRSAEGTDVVVSMENYCSTTATQDSDLFLNTVSKILDGLPPGAIERNFGITYDVGHMNIEGVDPLIAAAKIGKWCLDRHLNFRMHATDNYGQLHFAPPHYSADIHANVSGRGIDNAMIIKLLRALGLEFPVVAEQIEPLSKKDIETIHKAQHHVFAQPYEAILENGRGRIEATTGNPLIPREEVIEEEAFQFIAGMDGINALGEYLLFRKIQEKKYLTADEAKKSTIQIMSMPQQSQINIIDYLDDLLSPIQRDMAEIKNQDVDLIAQNIAGSLFGALNNKQLGSIFTDTKIFRQGRTICKQNMIGREIYFIKNGSVDIWGESSLIAKLGQGEIFGEISILYDIPRTASVKAAEDDTVIGILDRQQFLKLIKNVDNTTKAIIYRLYLFLPARLRALNEKYKIVISTLLHLTDGEGLEQDLKEKIKQPLDEGANLLHSNLSPKDLAELFVHTRQVPKETLLFREGDKPDGAYLVQEGRIGIVSRAGQEEILLAAFGEKDIFGEMGLIDGEPRSADARVLQDAILGFLPREEFNRIINDRSELSYRLMSSICLGLIGHIQRLDKQYLQVKSYIAHHRAESRAH